MTAVALLAATILLSGLLIQRPPDESAKPDIPEYGIQRDVDGRFVYVVSQGKVGRRQYSSLKTGEKVIVIGAEQVEVGDSVIAIDMDGES